MKPKSSADDLDLHGFTVAEAIEEFVRQYNARVDSDRYGCWKVIHGYGSTGKGGAIRLKLHGFLDQHLDKLRYEAGDDYGDPGWTLVYPRHLLPATWDRLATAIIAFCTTPRSEDRILREFVRSTGDLLAKKTLAMLVKQGRLKTVQKGTKPHYETVGG